MFRAATALRMAVLAVALALLAYAFATNSYLLTPLGFALVYAVFVAGLNVFMGYAGQVSFGQNAFAAIGGYGSAVLTATYAGNRLPRSWPARLRRACSRC